MSWTDERVELLSQLWLEGRSASQISAVLGAGLTRNAVIGKVHRLGLAGRAKTTSPSPSSSAGSSSARSAAPSSARRPTPRPATNAGSGASVNAVAGNGGGGGRVVHGNTVMTLAPEAAAEPEVVRTEEDVVVPMSLRVTIVDLKESMCRWPLGDPTSGDFRYCGSPAPGAGPYCSHHGKMAYQPMQDRRRERERERRTMIAR